MAWKWYGFKAFEIKEEQVEAYKKDGYKIWYWNDEKLKKYEESFK